MSRSRINSTFDHQGKINLIEFSDLSASDNSSHINYLLELINIKIERYNIISLPTRLKIHDSSRCT